MKISHSGQVTWDGSTAAGNYDFEIIASNKSGSVTHEYELIVNRKLLTTPDDIILYPKQILIVTQGTSEFILPVEMSSGLVGEDQISNVLSFELVVDPETSLDGVVVSNDGRVWALPEVNLEEAGSYKVKVNGQGNYQI